jgi:hypothetical protein
VELFIKRYALRERAEVVVKTKTLDPREELGTDNKISWLAPRLEYTYASQKNPDVGHKVSCYDQMQFEVYVLMEFPATAAAKSILL